MPKKKSFFHQENTIAILLAAGTGERFGSSTPKQFQKLGEKKVYQHALETLLNSKLFAHIILVIPKEHLDLVEEQASDTLHLIEGGTTRQASSYQGIVKAQELGGEIALIHDGARPFVTQEILEDNIRKAICYGAVDTCIPSADTLVHSPCGNIIHDIPKRAEMLRGQTPQTFQLPLILKAHKESGQESPTDDCSLVLAINHPVHIAQGSEENLKITTPLDLLIAEQIVSTRNKSSSLPEKSLALALESQH